MTKATPDRPGGSPAGLGLTEQQAKVLALIMQGKSNKAICRTLDLAEPTVKYHVAGILRTLKVNNRTQAALAASALGWKSPLPTEVGSAAAASMQISFGHAPQAATAEAAGTPHLPQDGALHPAMTASGMATSTARR